MKRNLVVFLVMVFVVSLFSLTQAGLFDRGSGDVGMNPKWIGAKSFKMGIDVGTLAPTAESRSLSESADFTFGGWLGFVLNDHLETDLIFNYMSFGDKGSQPFYIGGLKTKFFIRKLRQKGAVLHPYLFNVTGISYVKKVSVAQARGLPNDNGSNSFEEELAEAGGFGLDWMPFTNVWVSYEAGYYDYGNGFQFVMMKALVSLGLGW